MTEVIRQLTPEDKSAISREQLRLYAEASGDYNPIHLDDAVAKEKGLDSVIAHGMLSMAFLGDYLQTQFPHPKYRVRRFQVRFRKMAVPGDRLRCEGEVVKEAGGEIRVHLRTRNQREEVTTEGEADLLED